MDLTCEVCGKGFYVYPYRLKKGRPGFCSSKCYGRSKIGHIPWNKGRPWSSKVKKKLSIAHKGKIPWNKLPRVLIACEYCNVAFYPKSPNAGTKFCSKQCSDKNRIGKPGWGKGMKFPERSGENHFAWKGDLVSYSGLHKWVANTLGSPDACEHCDRKGLNGHKINWANKSKKYKRDLKDWVRLCVECHREYDA